MSNPPSQDSGQRGRNARIMARLMQAMAMMPLYCTMAARKVKKVAGWKTEGSAASHSAVISSSAPHNKIRMFRTAIPLLTGSATVAGGVACNVRIIMEHPP
ncbi:MAG: hypothetical protein NVV74_17410 [Magnetospirillum sp.]|nr:hypothetical protein [Magnetospirillum sp.]